MYEFGQAEIDAAARVMSSGQLFRYLNRTDGEAVRFERRWAKTIGCEHAIATNSGTSALICALVGANVGPGAEVIVPGYTFVATAIAVIAVGATPVIANVDETLTIDPDDAAQRITPSTRAIIPVHMSGLSCDMTRLMEIAAKYDLTIIEDVCQGAGGSYRGRNLGSIGHAGAFSFNHYKTLTCGEGGAVTTSVRSIYERALIYHDSACATFGSNAAKVSIPVFAGQNYRISEISAAILLEQASRLESILARLRRIREAVISTGPWPRLSILKSNDVEGDCATTIAWRCETMEFARQTAGRLTEAGFASVVPINTDKHVYSNWAPIWSQDQRLREAAERNEARLPLDPTLDNLGRTVTVLPTLHWTEADVDRLARTLRSNQ
jgi:dTDP-4-amino-4,6-dideoxygalactose transaminase